ncbi:MAG: hypothetical protein IPP48_03555 [Chitinophagaceae bacterium]|nr:hypothetical protein [Chitinophagaceae bacterium]
MKHNNYITAALIILTVTMLYACSKTETVTFKSPKSYMPAVKGKYIIYKLDSTVTRSFGSGFVTSSYTVKDSVVDVFTDNLGRESFKIFRYQLNPSNNTWASTNTFVLTPQESSIEFVENNNRYIKLINPVADGKTWKGNSFINQSPYYINYIFSEWNYTYDKVGSSRSVGSFTFPNTVTVVQSDSNDNDIFNPYSSNFYNKGYEIYADSVGLVYKDIMSWEYQVFRHFNNCILIRPKTTGTGNDTLGVNCNDPLTNCDSLMQRPNHKIKCDTVIDRFYYNGYGIKQTILSHN